MIAVSFHRKQGKGAAVGQGQSQQLRLCSPEPGGFFGGRTGFPPGSADVTENKSGMRGDCAPTDFLPLGPGGCQLHFSG